MTEQINLIAPEQASDGTTHYWINRSELDREGARVSFHLGSAKGFNKVITISGDDALAYLKALNKRNATVTSNEKWTLQQLVAKGYLSGTISGTPD